MAISEISLLKSQLTKVLLPVLLLCTYACSSVPKTPPKTHQSHPSESQEDEEHLMGPPSLLALTEGAIDTEQLADESELITPRLSLIKKSRPTTVIQLWFKAGAMYEQPAEYGATLLFDHLLTKDTSPEYLPRSLVNLGGRIQSWISLDRYVLSVEVSKEYTDKALTLIGKALADLPNSASVSSTLSSLQDQLPSTDSWLKRRLTSRLVNETINQLPVNKVQPIRSLQVEKNHIQNLTLEAAQAFLKRVSYPKNTHLVIVGDLDESAVRSSVATYLSSPRSSSLSIAENNTLTRPPQQKSAQKASVNVSIDIEPIKSQTTLIQIAFPMSHLTPDEASYLDLLSFILIGNQDGILHRKAKLAEVDLQSASTAPIITDKGSVFIVSLEVRSNQVDDGWNILLETLSTLIHQPVSQRHLEQAKSLFERETLLIGESLLGQARRFGFFSSHWPRVEALTQYGRAAYRVRPSSLFQFTQKRLMTSSPLVLIAGQKPIESNLNIWRERMTEQLKHMMTQRLSSDLVGFSKHGPKLNLLFAPYDNDGVTSLTVTLPLNISSHRSPLTSLTSLSLGHWFAALISEPISNEPHFEARFFDDSLTLSVTFPSHLIGEVFNALMRKLRQAPLRSETQWSSEYIERARKHALINLSKVDQDPIEKLKFLNQRVHHAFSKRRSPLPKDRVEHLSKLSSSDLTRWFSQHIQSLPMYVVISGDVKESSLSRVLSPLTSPSHQVPKVINELHSTPLTRKTVKPLKTCRSIKIIANDDETWASLSFPVPSQVIPESLRLLESALIHRAMTQPTNHGHRQILVEHHTRPSMLTVYLYATTQEFNRSWQDLLDDINHLKTALYAPEKLEEIKRYLYRIETQQFERSRTRVDWLIRAWFLGWHKKIPLSLSSWRTRLESLSSQNLQHAAKTIFVDEQARFSLITPPYLQVSPQLKCRIVVP